MLFSTVATPIYIPTNSAQGSPFLLILVEGCPFTQAVQRTLSRCCTDPFPTLFVDTVPSKRASCTSVNRTFQEKKSQKGISIGLVCGQGRGRMVVGFQTYSVYLFPS